MLAMVTWVLVASQLGLGGGWIIVGIIAEAIYRLLIDSIAEWEHNKKYHEKLRTEILNEIETGNPTGWK